MAEDELPKADYEALADFRFNLRRFLDFSQRAARDVGLTPQQHQALLSIMGQPGRETVTIGELAAHLLIQHHSAVELSNRLEALGLVRRQPDPADGRRVLLALTPAARGLLARMSAIHLEELRRIGPQLADLLARLNGGER
ncbi:MAG: MarR family transcriptional regulator [Dongiaceae bacterium]